MVYFLIIVSAETLFQKIISVTIFKDKEPNPEYGKLLICPKTTNKNPIAYNPSKWIEACNRMGKRCITKKTDNYQLFSKNIKENEIDTHHFHADEEKNVVYFKIITDDGDPKERYKRMIADIPEKGRQKDLTKLYNCRTGNYKRKTSGEEFNDLSDLFYEINKKAS